MKYPFMFFLLIMGAHFSYCEQKDKIAILTLKNSSGVTAGEAEIISDRLRNDFFATGIVDVMERDQMQSILNEQGLQQSGLCTDDGCMVELGKMLGVRRLIAGSIGKLGSLYLLNVRSIDVSTGKIDCAVTDDIKGEIEDVVSVLNAVASRVAGLNCSKETGIPEKPVQASVTVEEKKSVPSAPVVTAPPCDGGIYLEKIRFDPALLGFNLEESDKEDVEDALVDAFKEALDRDVVAVSGAQLSTLRCITKVLKCTIKSYTTESAARDQIKGTLKLAISVYESPSAKTPLTTVLVEKEGDRHWGQLKPFLNAVDEIIDVIEDDFYSEVRKYFK